MLAKRLLLIGGPAILVVLLIAWFFLHQAADEQPIIISDGSLHIKKINAAKTFDGWARPGDTHPSELYPPYTMLSKATVQIDGGSETSVCSPNTACTVDVWYERDAMSTIHLVYNPSANPKLTLTSEVQSFDTWKHYNSNHMNHPSDNYKIKQIVITGSNGGQYCANGAQDCIGTGFQHINVMFYVN